MIYVARHGFACEIDGIPYIVNQGTTVQSGHPLLKGNEDLFKEQVPDFAWKNDESAAPVEEATANPGEERPPVKRGPGRPRGSTTRKAR